MNNRLKAIRAAKAIVALHKGVNEDDLKAIEVWHCYILGNEKWLFAISDEGLLTSDYIEVTYNKAKGEFYIDRYVKQSNDCFNEKTLEP